MSKVCPGHGDQPAHTEPLTNFTKDKNRYDGKAAFCKWCLRQIQREWKQRNPDKVKAARRAYAQKNQKTGE